MTRIEVTQPAAEDSATLTLHTCSTCGTHRWERDGLPLDRDAVLGVVRERLAEGPASRVPKPRTPRARPVPTAVPEARTIDIREQLARFTVHGGPST